MSTKIFIGCNVSGSIGDTCPVGEIIFDGDGDGTYIADGTYIIDDADFAEFADITNEISAAEGKVLTPFSFTVVSNKITEFRFKI